MKREYNRSTGRNYKSDYAKFQSSEKAKKDRAARNKARRALEREGRVSKGDGKDVGHQNSNPRDNRRTNLRVESRKANRGKIDKNGKRI